MMKVSSSSIQRPLILSNRSQSSTKLFAYYAVHWDQKHVHPSDRPTDGETHLEINSCLYFQTEGEDEWEETRRDGSGYIVTYPPHLWPIDPLQIYNFDRSKDFLLTSDEVYSTSKSACIYFFPQHARSSRSNHSTEIRWKKAEILLTEPRKGESLHQLLSTPFSKRKCQISGGSMHLTFQLVTLFSFLSAYIIRDALNFISTLTRTHTSPRFVRARSPFSLSKSPHLEMLVKWTKKARNNNSKESWRSYLCAHTYIRAHTFYDLKKSVGVDRPWMIARRLFFCISCADRRLMRHLSRVDIHE